MSTKLVCIETKIGAEFFEEWGFVNEKPTSEYLRDLAERLMHVPATYGVDQGDVDRLIEIARELTKDV